MIPYFYSWEDGFSTDPNCDIWEKVMIVKCNSKKVSHVVYCLTGKNGVIKRHIADSNGKVMTDHSELLTEIIRGQVEMEYKHYKEES